MSRVRIPLGVTPSFPSPHFSRWTLVGVVVKFNFWSSCTSDWCLVVKGRVEALCCSSPLITPFNLVHSFSLHTLWFSPLTPANRCDSLSQPIHQSPCNCVTHAVRLYSAISPRHSWAVLNAFCLTLPLAFSVAYRAYLSLSLSIQRYTTCAPPPHLSFFSFVFSYIVKTDREVKSVRHFTLPF